MAYRVMSASQQPASPLFAFIAAACDRRALHVPFWPYTSGYHPTMGLYLPHDISTRSAVVAGMFIVHVKPFMPESGRRRSTAEYNYVEASSMAKDYAPKPPGAVCLSVLYTMGQIHGLADEFRLAREFLKY